MHVRLCLFTLHYVVFLANFSCGHYAADFLFTCSVTTIIKAKLTNQLLTSFVSRESRDEGGNNLRFLHHALFWIVSLQQWLNEAVVPPRFLRRILPISTPLTTKMSQCRQNYHEECEAGINKQINLELYASYVYMSMVGFEIAFERNTLSVGELELNAFYSCLKGLSLRSWWCGAARIPQVHAETVGRRTWTRSKGKARKLACTRSFASPSSFQPCLNLSFSFEILAYEIPESAWRSHCVARHQGKQE